MNVYFKNLPFINLSSDASLTKTKQLKMMNEAEVQETFAGSKIRKNPVTNEKEPVHPLTPVKKE